MQITSNIIYIYKTVRAICVHNSKKEGLKNRSKNIREKYSASHGMQIIHYVEKDVIVRCS